MGKKNDEDRLSAHHEAGHVVGRLRIPTGVTQIMYATIERGSRNERNSSGYSEAAWRPEGESPSSEEETVVAFKAMVRTPEYIRMTLAGIAAEFVYLRLPDSMAEDFLTGYHLDRAGQYGRAERCPDEVEAYNLLKIEGDDGNMGRFIAAWEDAIAFAREEWASINRIARLLMEKKTVQGAELCDCLSEVAS